MSVTGAARGTSQRRLFYRCGASIYRGRGRLGAVRSVCRTAGLGVGRAGAPTVGGVSWFRCRSTAPGAKAESNHSTGPARSHTGRVLLRLEEYPGSGAGAPPPVRKRSQTAAPGPSRSHTGRVLLRLEEYPGSGVG